eukprot:1138880-Pelagomonas_calceolata.AAC.2
MDLLKHIMHSVARFCLCIHTLKVESKLSKLHGMTTSILPVIFLMPKMMCRMNSILYSNELTLGSVLFG